MRFLKLTGLTALLCAVSIMGFTVPAICEEQEPVLLKTSFEDAAKGWTAKDQASVSDISRRKGGKSLLIKQWKDEEQGTQWLSPEIANPGKSVLISFWAADNYFKQTDFSYAAVLDAVDYDKDGKELSRSSYLRSMPWDDERKSDLWGQRLQEGLLWKYYEIVYNPKGAKFRLLFHWPKPIVRGECYLTDLMLSVATPEQVRALTPGAKTEEATESRFKLELSAPTIGNLFYLDDPLRFEALLYTADAKPIGDLVRPSVRYEITDFEKHFIARGEMPFDKAAPVADQAFYKSGVGAKRKCNLRQTIPVNDPAAHETGREFFIYAELLSDGKPIAADTITYGVVNPRAIAQADYKDCRFSSPYFMQGFTDTLSKHNDQSIAVKSGIVRKHVIDFYWIRCQPKYPGPISFTDKLPLFPPTVFCPDLEQLRTNEADLKRMVPPECLIPDPLHPGRLTFQIDPYVEYIVAYIRHNRNSIIGVIPSGLERPIDARTIELHRKAYAAIKKEWPDLPVGMMLYGLPMNPSADVDIFINNKLFDCADFIDTHVYAASVDWTEWKRLQGAYRKLGLTPPPLISTEFCRVGGSDQVLHSRDTVAAHMDAFANEMDHVYYFNCCNGEGTAMLQAPFLREPTDLGGDQTSGFMYMQRVERPRVSPETKSTQPWARGSWGMELGGDSLMPVLQAMTYYNLVQNFELAKFRASFKPSPNSVAYIFDRGDQTICSLWLSKPVAEETMLIHGDTAYTVQDLFGRKEKISPLGGVSLLSVGENPQTLVFDKRVVLFEGEGKPKGIEKVEGGLELKPLARGSKGSVGISIPPVFPANAGLQISGTVDGTWPNVSKASVKLSQGQELKASLAITLPPEKAVGNYPFTVRLSVDGKLAALLKAPLQVEELLKLEVSAVPMTKTQEPAIEAKISNLQDKASKGTVTLISNSLAAGMRAVPQTLPYEVPANGTFSVRFPVPRDLVNLTASYMVTVSLVSTDGIRISREEELGFRATRHAPGPIKIDGDLSDWHLEDQPAIPFERKHTVWGKAWNGPQDLSGVFYTLWDDEYLYFAAIINDDSHVTRGNDIEIWQDDNIMLGLYPWGLKKGETLNSGYYREHLGLCKDGEARIFRVGNVAIGPTTASGAKIAVKRSPSGYVYEWAYPKACIAPMVLEKDAHFRLSLFAWDTDFLADGKTYSKLGGIQFFGFNTSIDARPEKWGDFILTDK